MGSTEVRPGVPLASVAQSMPRDKLNQLLAWVNKRGPFIESDRQTVEDDLFFFGETEVTELGLGEAARRIVTSLCAAVLSVVDNQRSRFFATPLRVMQGLPDEIIDCIDVPNYWDGMVLSRALADLAPEPATWNELLSSCREVYDRLLVGSHCDEILAPHPYNPAIGRRVKALLEVLQLLMLQMRPDGSLTPTGNTLLQKYFVGKRALFTDESDSRKQNPSAFTFPDPEGSGTLTCYWHGKVSSKAYRLHFEWPVQPPRERLRVAYIGPKIA